MTRPVLVIDAPDTGAVSRSWAPYTWPLFPTATVDETRPTPCDSVPWVLAHGLALGGAQLAAAPDRDRGRYSDGSS